MKSKMMMKAERMDNTIENILTLENLRFKAYNIKGGLEGPTFYSLGLKEGTMVPFGFYLNDTLIAGCYVSANYGMLYIEQLFVHPQLQNSGLRAGRLLLNYVLLNKKELEDYFKTEFTYSALEPSNEKSQAIYEKIGYTANEMLMRKRLK